MYKEEIEWPEKIYLTSHLNTNYTSGYLIKILHRVKRNKSP